MNIYQAEPVDICIFFPPLLLFCKLWLKDGEEKKTGGEGKGRERKDDCSFPVHHIAHCRGIIFVLMPDHFCKPRRTGSANFKVPLLSLFAEVQ